MSVFTDSPIDVLERQIESFKTMQLRLETGQGVDKTQWESNKELMHKLYTDLDMKVMEFEDAINKLKTK